MKTRIAAKAGPETALAIYKELLRHTRTVAQECDVDRHLFYTDQIEHNDLWSNSKFQKHIQATGDLGEKMHLAFKHCFRSADQVVIIGSDCVSLTSEVINKAFADLESKDLVIGPTYDGGYYLLGMNTPTAKLFENIEWSTETVFDQTMGKAKQLGLTHAILPILSDIDHIEDWEKWGWTI